MTLMICNGHKSRVGRLANYLNKKSVDGLAKTFVGLIMVVLACGTFYFQRSDLNLSNLNAPASSTRLQPLACDYYSSHRQLNCYTFKTKEGYELPVAVFKGEKTAAPVLYLSGGPGLWGNTEEVSLQSWEYWLLNTRVKGDFILFDYRALKTEGFMCEAYRQLSKKFLSTALDDQEVYQQSQTVLNECLHALRADLKQKGQNLQQFNSLTNAHDGHDLMSDLGYAQWDIVAASYGTRVALIMANAHQEKVRRMILDGVYPPGAGGMIESRRSWVQAFENYWQWCENDTLCSGVLQKPEESFWSAMKALANNPLPVQIQDWSDDQAHSWLLNDVHFSGAIYSAFYSRELRKDIPYFIRSVLDRSENFDSLIPEFFFNNAFDSNFNGFMFTVTECNDNPLTQKTEYERYLAGLPRWRKIMQYDWEWSACQNLGFDPVNLPSLDNLPVPTLLVSGEFDPVTPMAYAEALLSEFQSAWVVEAKGMGHSEFTGSECGAELIGEFLNGSPALAIRKIKNTVQECQYGLDLAEK